MGAEEDELKKLEKELAEKKRLLESPFAAVGLSEAKPRGRPPKGTVPHNSTDNNIAYDQRMAEVPVPASNLSSEGMRDWGEKEIHTLIPAAVASLKWDIKYGDSKQRSEARSEIFKATGIAQKDANNFGKGGQIIINLNDANAAGINLPFLNRVKPNDEPAKPIVQTLADKEKK